MHFSYEFIHAIIIISLRKKFPQGYPNTTFELNSFLCRNILIDCNPRHTRKVTSTIIINQKSGSIYLLALSAEDRFATTPIKSNYEGTVNYVAKHREIVVLFYLWSYTRTNTEKRNRGRAGCLVCYRSQAFKQNM